MEIEGNFGSLSIEPMLLIPFVENAFKHISHFKNQLNFIQLNLTMQKGVFCFKITNSKEAMEKVTDHASGIGLSNVQRRLELLYPGKHSLVINNTNENFSVELQLNIIN